MRKKNGLRGLSHQGRGYILYKDESNPRLTDAQVVKKVGKYLNKEVVLISSTPHVGHRDTVLQDERLYDKDVMRSAKRLAKKFNKKII